MRADVRDELYEEVERRVAADEQAGRVFYPWTAVGRQSRPLPNNALKLANDGGPSLYLESMARQTRPRWGRGTILTAALALAMGVLGWGIGALRRAGAIDAGAWWSLAWFALMILDGRFLYPGNGVTQYIGRAPTGCRWRSSRPRRSRSRSQLAARQIRAERSSPLRTLYSSAHAVSVVPDGTSRCWRPSICRSSATCRAASRPSDSATAACRCVNRAPAGCRRRRH